MAGKTREAWAGGEVRRNPFGPIDRHAQYPSRYDAAVSERAAHFFGFANASIAVGAYGMMQPLD